MGLSTLRRLWLRLVDLTVSKTGWPRKQVKRLYTVSTTIFVVAAVWVFGHFTRLPDIPPESVVQMDVGGLVESLPQVSRLVVFGMGSGDPDARIDVYAYMKSKKVGEVSLTKARFMALDEKTLSPSKVKIELKSDSERPGSVPAFEIFGGLLFDLFRMIPTFMNIAMLVFMARMMGLGNKRFEIIRPENIEGSMDDLVGMEDIKQETLMIADLFDRRALFRAHGMTSTWNILYSGPAGVGKTKMAGYLAKRLGVPLLFIDGSRLETGMVGGGSRTLKSLERKAASLGRCVVFIDEGQALLMKRGTANRSRWEDDTPNTLLTLLDGIRTKGKAETIWVVASNFDRHSSEMDAAVLRRFKLKVNFRLPNLMERREMIERFVGRRESQVKAQNIDFNALAQASGGLSPDDLQTVVDQASLIAIREQTPMDATTLMRALERTVVGLADRAQTEGQEDERRLIAVHETGHFMGSVLRYAAQGLTLEEAKRRTKTLKISTESVSSVGALGFAMNAQSDVRLYSVNDLEWMIRGIYGGRAAEQAVYGLIGITTGAANDIEVASKSLVDMISKLGFFGLAPVNLTPYRGQNAYGGPVLHWEEEAEIKRVAARLYGETLALMEGASKTLRGIANTLYDDYTLDKDALFDLLGADWVGLQEMARGVMVMPAIERSEPVEHRSGELVAAFEGTPAVDC